MKPHFAPTVDREPRRVPVVIDSRYPFGYLAAWLDIFTNVNFEYMTKFREELDSSMENISRFAIENAEVSQRRLHLRELIVSKPRSCPLI